MTMPPMFEDGHPTDQGGLVTVDKSTHKSTFAGPALVRMPDLYVVAMHYPTSEKDAPSWLYLDWCDHPGPRVAARVTGDIEDAVLAAGRAAAGRHNPAVVCVFQLTDNTAGVMGALAEVLRISWTVRA